MGDRGNVKVIDPNGEVYLYTHWSGSELAKIVRQALDRGRDRWSDSAYLTRIIFSEMIKDDIDGTTGYGISPVQCDTGMLVIVDVTEQKVQVVDEWDDPPAPSPVSFSVYVEDSPPPLYDTQDVGGGMASILHNGVPTGLPLLPVEEAARVADTLNSAP